MEINSLTAKTAYFDTNVFIYLIENNPEYKDIITQLIQHLDTLDCQIYTSDLTLAECLVKPFADNDIDSQQCYKQSIANSDFLTVKQVSRNTLINAAKMRSLVKNKLPDSIHLATALQCECAIFVGNDKKLRTTEDIQHVILADLV